MIKSWADCSSDEDTDDNYSVESEEQAKEQTLDAAFSEKVQVDGQGPNEAGGPEQQPPQVRTYDFPDRAPFTAFVGNLSYDIQESSQLQQALADVVFERLGQRINVLGGRISFDRNSENRQHRGFGYVELETLEELKMVMKLNDDGQALLAGRNVQVDTANHQNRSNNKFNQRGQQGSNNNNRHDNPRGSFNRFNDARPQNNEPFEKIDGSKFRGGKFNNNDKNSNNNNSFRNNNTSSSNNNNNNSNNGFRNNNNASNNNNNNSFRSSSFQKGPDSGDAPRQRPSLKLAPRSKPVDGEKNATSSNIFGGAKARDEQTWKKSRQQQQQDQPASGGDETKKTTTVSSKKGGEDNNSNNNNNNNKTVGKDKKTESQDRRQSGRGGGRGGKGRGNNQRGGSNNSGRGDQKDKRGSGKKQHDKKQDKKQQQLISPEEKAAAAAAKTNNKTSDAPPSNPEPKAPKAPKNRFALLNDSDSD